MFVAYAPTFDCEDEEVEAFYAELENFYKENHTFYKVIVVGDFNAKIEPRRSPEELHIGTHGLDLTDVSIVTKFYTGLGHRLLHAGFRFSHKGEKATKFKKRNTVMDNIDEEYDRFVHHLRDSANKETHLTLR
ncbi:unnamed protein product [Heligmosomoides polygyrus]|uniref:Endo/exonuclease/phosphatase domain-containing protein n=1 Tax=Heligmosomoides polygyrus TaxID=6339 RepID=A0A183GIQ1_HELPZ|nr:unnamed protein product [Heligmosomoides polygyrus]